MKKNETEKALEALSQLFESESAEYEMEEYLNGLDEFMLWSDVHVDRSWLDGTDFQMNDEGC